MAKQDMSELGFGKDHETETSEGYEKDKIDQ